MNLCSNDSKEFSPTEIFVCLLFVVTYVTIILIMLPKSHLHVLIKKSQQIKGNLKEVFWSKKQTLIPNIHILCYTHNTCKKV